MKEPPPPPLLPFPPSRLKKLQSPQKIKILCSFNGDFLPCPPSGKLRYIGGETRIISISRGIGISQLISKISDLCPKYPSLSIKYQVLEQGGDLPLVPVETDEDIRHMILEYDKLVADGKQVRLRVFACGANGNGYVGSHAGSCCYFNSNRSVLGRENTSENEIPMTLMDRICNSNDLYASNDLKQKIMSTQFAGVQNSDESFGPVAHSRRILSTQIAGTQNSHDFFMIDASGPKNSSDHVMKFVSSDNSFSQRELRPQNLTPHITGIPSFVGSCRTNSGPQNMTFYRTDIQSLGSSHDLPEFQSKSSLGQFKDPFGSAGCNESVRVVEFPNQRCNLKQGFRKFGQQCMEEVYAENIVPGYVYCYPVETRLVPVTCSGNLSRDILPLKAFNGNDGVLSSHNDMAINHQICKSNIKDNRINSYDTQNLYNNLHDVQNLQDCGFNGKPCNGKYYSGAMSRSNTLELGQARFNLDHLSKPSYGAYDHVMEGMEKVASSGRGTQTLLHHDGSRGALQERVLKPSNVRSLDRLVEMGYGNSNLHRSHFENCCLPQKFSESHNLSHHVDCCPRSPCNVTDKQTCFGTISVESGLLCDSYLVNPEVPSTSPCNKPFNNINKFSGVCKDSSNYPESNAAHFRNLNGTSSKLNGDSESAYEIAHPLDCIFEVVESSAKESASDSDLNEKSPEDLSLHFLSFSSPKEVGPSSQSSPLSSSGNSGSNEGLPVDDRNPTDSFSISIQDYASPRCEMWPYFKQLNPIDSKPLGSGLLMENLTEARIHRTDDDEKSYSIDTFVEDLTRSGSSSKLSGPFSLVAAHVSSNTGNGLDHGEGKQQSMPSNLNMEEKANVEGSHCCSTAGGQTGSIHLAFNTHLGTQELQTIRNSDLEEIREVGSGTYGTVYYGKWKGSDVAIKRIKPSSFNGGDLGEDRLIADFWKEAHLLGQLHHPNVVAFYGVVTDGPAKSLAAVTEYMVNGSLKQVLQRKDRTIDRRKRLIIAMDVAFGMEYLHEKNIVHFDLKSHNLLVNMRDPHRPVCKIGDLGLYKVKQRTLISGGVRGTIPWMAPELLSSKSGMVTEKVDVYSFGIVMWELLTGDEPYASMRSAEILAGIIKGDLRPEIPNWCDPAWKSLMERCWSSDPNSRSSFSEISKELRTIAASMNIK